MRVLTSIRRPLFAALLLWGFSPRCAFANEARLLGHLEDAFNKQQWNQVVQGSADVLRLNPSSHSARLYGAFALFQKGYPNAALLLLKPLRKEDWKNAPANVKRLVEVVALFQKQVPLISLSARMDQLNESESSSFLQDEIRFAKGRAAFEKKDFETAKIFLRQVNRGSRFYAPANYLLGTVAVQQKQLSEAQGNFIRTFDSQILQQSTEFWNGMDAQSGTQWGLSFNVLLDTDALKKASLIGELSVLGVARTLYAQKKFHEALAQYAKIPPASALYSRSRLETVWTLLQLDQHPEAQKVAADLSTDLTHFESLEAQPLRALILADAGKTEEGRTEVGRFLERYQQSKAALRRYRQFPNPEGLPDYIKADLRDDTRMDRISAYRSGLEKEIENLRKEEVRYYPKFSSLASELEPFLMQSRHYGEQITLEYVDRRLSDLERLYVQAHLILAETHLEDREKLRREFAGKPVTDEKIQDTHDQKLVHLLKQAIDEVDKARAASSAPNPSLEFRQAELLWELSSASAFLSKEETGTNGKEAYETYRRRAMKIIADLINRYPTFHKRADALFLLGFAHMEMGEEKEGLAYLQKYIAEFPQYDNAPNAYRILADAEFDANRFNQAEALYKKILGFASSPILGYALYKIGWCNYGNKKTATALLALEQAIVWTRNMENTEHLLNLKREAGRDLISIYAEVGNHKKAYEYFERFIGGDASQWVADLAREYERNGLFEKSNDLYTQLLTLSPGPEARMQYQIAIIQGSYQLRQWNKVLEHTRDFVGGFETVLQPEQDLATPSGKAQAVLNEIVLAQHFEFDQYAKPEDIDRILSIDELYLRAFHQWKASQMPLYQYAHFLLKYKKTQEAAAAFIDHWTKFSSVLKEPLKEESLRNIIHTLETLDQEKTADPGTVAKRVDGIIHYSGLFAEQYPNSKHARPIAFLRSVTQLKHGQTEAGITDSQKVFDANPTDDFGTRAFKNLRVAYYGTKDWKRTFEWASQSLQSPRLSKGQIDDLRTVREESLFLWADHTQEPLAAASLYTKIADDPQMQRLRPKALYNTFLRYKEADDRVLALETASQLEKLAPQFKELKEIAGVRAAFYQEAGEYEKALPLFEQFIQRPGNSAEALLQAQMSLAVIAENLNRPELAVRLYSQVIKTAAKENPAMADAKRGLERMDKKSQRAPASTPFKKWDALMITLQSLERSPLPKGPNLPARIQAGAASLEKVIRSFFEVSSDPQTPNYYAFEAYCAVPFLYQYYQQGIRSLGTDQPEELKTELEKLAGPLSVKSEEVALQCLERASEAVHDGPWYRKTLKNWGWQKDSTLQASVERLRMLLASQAPWIEQTPLALSEKELVRLHLEQKGTEDSWYSLARRRLEASKIGLAKITLLAALGKNPDSPRLLNAIAIIKQIEKTEVGALQEFFQKAAQAGSAPAAANLALIHLNGGRLNQARLALEQAVQHGAFKGQPELLSEIDSLLGQNRNRNPTHSAPNQAPRGNSP